MDDDSSHSGDDINIDDGIKLVKALPIKLRLELEQDYKVENGLHVWEDLTKTLMHWIPGEVKVLEAFWDSPESLLYDHHLMYTGEVQETDQLEVEEKLNHTH